MLLDIRTITLTVLVILSISMLSAGDKPPASPLVFNNWPPKHKQQSLRHQLMSQLRTSGRLPQVMMLKRYPQRFVRPMKLQVMPHFLMKKHPLPMYFKPTLSTPSRIPFRSSPPGPHSNEYIYEVPYTTAATQTNKNPNLVTPEKHGPIHTIPAPNLSYSAGPKTVQEAVDNHLHEKDQLKPVATYRPTNIHQYQVTESINDHTVRDSPLAKNKLHATESGFDGSAYKIKSVSSTVDTSGQNTITAKLQTQAPLDINVVSASANVPSVPATAALIQLSNSIPQQQLPDTYALPLSNQPQLQQHILQQQSVYGGVPLSVYNPTYLVTQSNQLLNQHKQHLFKPSGTFVGGDSPVPEAQPLTVASAGQIFSSNQDRLNDVRTEYSFNTFQGANSNVNQPLYERLISPQNSNPESPVQNIQQQPILSEQEVVNLLNYGNLNGQLQNQNFIASTYYQTAPSDSTLGSAVQFDQLTNQQILNDNTIRPGQANEDKNQKNQNLRETTPPPSSYQFVTTQTAIPIDGSALEEHQKKLAKHFGDQAPLHIYVPDDDLTFSNKPDVRRSDNISGTETESEEEQYSYEEDPLSVTTDGGEEYFSSENAIRRGKFTLGSLKTNDGGGATTTIENIRDYSTYNYY